MTNQVDYHCCLDTVYRELKTLGQPCMSLPHMLRLLCRSLCTLHPPGIPKHVPSQCSCLCLSLYLSLRLKIVFTDSVHLLDLTSVLVVDRRRLYR